MQLFIIPDCQQLCRLQYNVHSKVTQVKLFQLEGGGKDVQE